MTDTTVKFFHNAMTGAPVLSGQAGALIAVLDACLKDGFGLVTASSVVVAGNVATMTFASGHPFEVGAVALVAGATPSGLNGEQRITAVTTNSASFATTGISDQTASGTITAKLAPLGWTKQYSDTNLAAYKSTNVTGTQFLLRVDDTGTLNARVLGYESMSNINTGAGLFPTASLLSGGAYFSKSSGANSTARNWRVFGDDRAFYFWSVPNAPTTVTSQGLMHYFGDFVPNGSTDMFPCLCAGATADRTTSYGYEDVLQSYLSPSGAFVPRSYTGLGSAQTLQLYAESRLFITTQVMSGGGGAVYPNGPDGALLFNRTLVTEGAHIRGKLPGLLYIPQNVGFEFATGDVVAGAGDFAGKRLMFVRCGAPVAGAVQNSNVAPNGVCAFDLSGPWR